MLASNKTIITHQAPRGLDFPTLAGGGGSHTFLEV